MKYLITLSLLWVMQGCITPNCDFDLSNVRGRLVYDSATKEYAVKAHYAYGDSGFVTKSRYKGFLHIGDPDDYRKIVTSKDSCFVKWVAYSIYIDDILPEIEEKQKAKQFK